MPRKKRTFVDSGELRAVAQGLVKQYVEMLANVDLDQIYFAFCTSERAKNSRAAVMMTGVSNPLPGMVTSKMYQIAVYRDDWEDWTPARRHATILEALCYVDEDGRYKKPDVKELYPFARLWGPDWRDDPSIPDVLDEFVEFPSRPDDGKEQEGKKRKKDPVLADIIDEEEVGKRALKARDERLGSTSDESSKNLQLEF